MLQLKRLDHFGISARDPTASAAFYRDVLGMSPDEGPGRENVRLGSLGIAISQSRPGETPGRRPRGDHFAFLTDAETVEHVEAVLAERGVAFERRPGRIYFEDPDGYVVEFVFRAADGVGG